MRKAEPYLDVARGIVRFVAAAVLYGFACLALLRILFGLDDQLFVTALDSLVELTIAGAVVRAAFSTTARTMARGAYDHIRNRYR